MAVLFGLVAGSVSDIQDVTPAGAPSSAVLPKRGKGVGWCLLKTIFTASSWIRPTKCTTLFQFQCLITV